MEDDICWIDEAEELTAEELLEMAALDAGIDTGAIEIWILFGTDDVVSST